MLQRPTNRFQKAPTEVLITVGTHTHTHARSVGSGVFPKAAAAGGRATHNSAAARGGAGWGGRGTGRWRRVRVSTSRGDAQVRPSRLNESTQKFGAASNMAAATGSSLATARNPGTRTRSPLSCRGHRSPIDDRNNGAMRSSHTGIASPFIYLYLRLR